jgi:hypothetical protein
METAQTLDESSAAEEVMDAEGNRLAAFARYKGVQFVVAVSPTDKTRREHWGAEDPEGLADWITEITRSLQSIGEKLAAGSLEQIEGLGSQRHVAVLPGQEELLGVGFTRSAPISHIRETMKQIEARWAC